MRTANPLSKHQLTEVDGLSSKTIKLVCRERVWSSVKETFQAGELNRVIWTEPIRTAEAARWLDVGTTNIPVTTNDLSPPQVKKKWEMLMSTNFSFVFNYTLVLDDDKIVGSISSDEDRQPIEASANRNRRLTKQRYQAGLPRTSREKTRILFWLIIQMRNVTYRFNCVCSFRSGKSIDWSDEPSKLLKNSKTAEETYM